MQPTALHDMNVLQVWWRMNVTPQWQGTVPRGYNFGGFTPNGAASEGELTNRYASLYIRSTDSLLRTSREYYTRAKPGGYTAEGLEIGATLDDSLSLAFTARLYDVWMSDDAKSAGIPMIAYAKPDSLSDMLGTLRTKNFATGDSVAIGGQVSVSFSYGDSAALVGKTIDYITELVDSSTGDVVFVLDSTRLDVEHSSKSILLDSTLDLLSGTYYVRVRLVSTEFNPNVALDTTVSWSTTEIRGWIDALAGKRARRLGGETGSGIRVSAQPNPFTGETEFRFSISRREHVTLKVYDGLGREVARLIEKELYDPGRYAVEFQAGELPSGQYIVELQTLNDRVVEKIVVKR